MNGARLNRRGHPRTLAAGIAVFAALSIAGCGSHHPAQTTPAAPPAGPNGAVPTSTAASATATASAFGPGVPISIGDVTAFRIAATPDGRRLYVATTSDGGALSVVVIDAAANSVVGSPIEADNLQDMAMAPDGRSVYLAQTGQLGILDTASNTVGANPVQISAFGVAISPDGHRAYVTDGELIVSVIDTTANSTVGAPINVGKGPGAVAMSPDGKRAYVANNQDGTVSVLDTGSNSVVGQPVKVDAGPTALTMSPDGQRLYVVSPISGTISVIDTASAAVVGPSIPLNSYENTGRAVVSPDGAHLYVTFNDQLWAVDTKTNTVVGTPVNLEGADGIAVSPDGKHLYAGSKGTVTVYALNT